MKPPLLWSRLVWPLGLTLLVVVAVMAWQGQHRVDIAQREATYRELEHIAGIAGAELVKSLGAIEAIEAGDTKSQPADWVKQVRGLCVELGRLTDARLTVINKDGVVVGDSHGDPARMDNHADRPEVSVAFSGRIGARDRYSDTLDLWMRYVAVPVARRPGDPVYAVVRVARPHALEDGVTAWPALFMWGAGVSIIGLLVMSAAVRHWVTRPLAAMVRAARRTGEPARVDSVSVWDSRETSALASAVRQLALRGERNLIAAREENGKQRSVLKSMSEGLIAVDLDERILNINRAAAQIFNVSNVSLREVTGRALQEVIRHSQLQRFVMKLLRSDEMIDEDMIVIVRGRERFLQARGSALRDAQERRIGGVIVINDVTRLRRLENMRRDFAANVSHELKTPITAIKGFIETLRDGAIADQERAAEFMEIIARQTERLESIVDDLLKLARIEQEQERDQLDAMTQRLAPIIEVAARQYAAAAADRGVAVKLDLDQSIKATIDGTLIEQAVCNLVDNAIKYSPSGSVVHVMLEAHDMHDAHQAEARIIVRDEGCGVAEEHQKRLFQRFYRVDRARSRALGGTGLGLAIVKHIMLAHGGSAEIHSKPGQGSTFTLRLPLAGAMTQTLT